MEQHNIDPAITQHESQTTNQAPVSTKQTEQKPAGYWAFLGLIILFAIPVIGWIACIVFMFAPKDKSLKNYARAAFTWMVTKGAVAAVILALLVAAIGSFVTMTVNDQFGLQFDNIFEMVDMVVGVMNGNYSQAVAHLQPQLIALFGEEYAPLLAELAKDEYNDMLHEIADGDYAILLDQVRNNQYPNLASALGEEKYADFITKLESAANGESMEFFDGIREMLSFVHRP